MNNEQLLGLSLAVMLLFLGLLCIGASVYVLFGNRRLLNQPGRCRGQIIGLVRIGPISTHTEGEVPLYAHTAYGGNAVSRVIPLFPWFPCVRYTVGERTYTRLIGNGVREGVWRVGQSVRLRYDPASPITCAIEEDPSPEIMSRLGVLAGLVISIIGAAWLIVLAVL